MCMFKFNLYFFFYTVTTCKLLHMQCTYAPTTKYTLQNTYTHAHTHMHPYTHTHIHTNDDDADTHDVDDVHIGDADCVTAYQL